MIGVVFELVEWFIKLSILLAWLTIVFTIWVGWLVLAGIQLCCKSEVTPWPKDISRSTEKLLHHLL